MIQPFRDRRIRIMLAKASVAVFAFTMFAPPQTILAQEIAPVAPQGQAEQVRAEYESLKSYIKSLSRADITPKEKESLLKKLDNSLEKFANADYCAAANRLNSYLEEALSKRRNKRSNVSEELFAKGWTLRANVLALQPAGQKCKGFENIGVDVKNTETRSDNKNYGGSLAFPLPTLTVIDGNGQKFSQMHIKGLEDQSGKPGEPALPVWRGLVGIPKGSTPVINAKVKGDNLNLPLRLAPFQSQAVDQEVQEPGVPKPATFANKPFVINQKTYDTNEFLPKKPCTVNTIGQYRDLQIAEIECTAAQYNGKTDTLKLFQGFDFTLDFQGGDGKFLTTQGISTFEDGNLLSGSVLNASILRNYVTEFNFSALPCFGEEFMILTHPNFRTAANTLAAWKNTKGISTNVYNVGVGTVRNTAQKIDDFIEDHYDECQVRPKYIMLMGDAEYIPTFYVASLPENAGTDFPYSNYVQILFDAMIPDFGLGRVPVDTLDQANTVVNKIINYEKTPPFKGFLSGAPFYNTASIAAQFQCCRMNQNGTSLNGQPGTDQRGFIESSEFFRNNTMSAGYNVDRIYTETVDSGGYCLVNASPCPPGQVQQAYSGNQTPRRYFSGALLPGDLGGGSGFAWNGTGSDIVSDWNDGRFLMVHRDHGWPGGWANPGFSTGSIDSLTNGAFLPVVISVNCASGLFDNETAGGVYGTTNGGVYFAEKLLRKADGGAIGVIGDTRNSPTWANNALLRGFTDAMFPNSIPSFGGNTKHRRLGDILNWGKIYLFTQMNQPQPAGSVSVDDMGYEYNIWGLTGDPTLEMWTSNPHKLILTTEFKLAQSNAGYLIDYAQDGASLTALQKQDDGTSKPIARGTVIGGKADLKFFNKPQDGKPVILSASFENSASVELKQAPQVDTFYKGEYFSNQTLAGQPVLTRNDAAINFDWGAGTPDPSIPVDRFSVRWTKNHNFTAGNHSFKLTGDDGIRLYIDDVLVINGWKDQAVTTYTATKSLTAGVHKIRVEYYDRKGGAIAKFSFN